MIEYGRVEEWLHVFLTSALDEGEWSASRPGGVTSRERSPGTYWTDARWDAEVVWTLSRREKQIHATDGNGTTVPRSSNPLSSDYTDCVIPAAYISMEMVYKFGFALSNPSTLISKPFTSCVTLGTANKYLFGCHKLMTSWVSFVTYITKWVTKHNWKMTWNFLYKELINSELLKLKHIASADCLPVDTITSQNTLNSQQQRCHDCNFRSPLLCCRKSASTRTGQEAITIAIIFLSRIGKSYTPIKIRSA
jgi:hypothetical protein